jgi:hypothetical protein
MLGINDPLGSGRRGAPLDAAARRRIADEDMAMAVPVPRDDFRSFPVEMPLTRDEKILAEAQAAIKRYSTGAGRDAAGNLLPVAPEQPFDYGARRDAAGNLLPVAPDYELTEAIEAANTADSPFFNVPRFNPDSLQAAVDRDRELDRTLDREVPQTPAAARVNRRGADVPAAQGLAQFIEENRSAIPGYNLPGPSTPYVIDPDAAAEAGRSLSLQDQMLGLGFTGGDIDPSPLRIAATAASKPLSYDDLVAKAKAGSPVTESDLVASVEAGLLNDNQAADINAMIDDSSYIPSAQEQRISNLERTNRMPPSGPVNPDLLGSRVFRGIGDYAAGVFGGRTIGEQDAIDTERAEETAAFAQAKALEVPVGSMVERPATEKTVSDASRRAADSMQGTGVTSIGGRQVADAIATIKDPAAMPPPVQPRTGTRTGKKSGILAEKNKMDQDKWLALAQAGFVLMSTGDFGKAGSAGLAAYREAQKADREERKLDAELLLREAQLAAANRAPAAKAIPAAYLTDLRKQKEAIQLQLASLRPPEEAGFMKGAKDPDAAARIRLENELAGLNERINRMYAQYNLGVSPPSNRRKTV